MKESLGRMFTSQGEPKGVMRDSHPASGGSHCRPWAWTSQWDYWNQAPSVALGRRLLLSSCGSKGTQPLSSQGRAKGARAIKNFTILSPTLLLLCLPLTEPIWSQGAKEPSHKKVHKSQPAGALGRVSVDLQVQRRIFSTGSTWLWASYEKSVLMPASSVLSKGHLVDVSWTHEYGEQRCLHLLIN